MPRSGRTRRLRLLSAALLSVLALGAGCATVPPWERGTLAHASMDPEDGGRAAHDDFFTHIFDVREGATGGSGHAGGGCGCN